MDMTDYHKFLLSAEKYAYKGKDNSHFYRTSYSPIRKYSDIKGTTSKPVILPTTRVKEHLRKREFDDFSSLCADTFLKMYMENDNKISEHNQNVKLYANEKIDEKRQKNEKEIVKTMKKPNEKLIENQDLDTNKKVEQKEKENSNKVPSKAVAQKTDVENKTTSKRKKKADNTSKKEKSRKTKTKTVRVESSVENLQKPEIENLRRSVKNSNKTEVKNKTETFHQERDDNTSGEVEKNLENANKNGHINNVNKAQINFKTLLQLAEQKQHEPVSQNVAKTEERPLTAKEKQFYEEIRLARENKRDQAEKEIKTLNLIGKANSIVKRSNNSTNQRDKKRLKTAIKSNQISEPENDHDDEISEFDDFIDDDDETEDVSEHIKEIFGYDKSKYINTNEDDIVIESSFAEMQHEELMSKRIGLKEDLDDVRLEKLKKSKKRQLLLT